MDCFYYGRRCAFGKGRAERFDREEIGRADVVPGFLVVLVPAVAALVLVAHAFSWTILALVILGFPGTAAVRERLACRYCRQRERGCPAERLCARKRA
ncbi:MAG: hypothetical protein ACP5C4_08990 [Methanomicrobiales archaeon]